MVIKPWVGLFLFSFMLFSLPVQAQMQAVSTEGGPRLVGRHGGQSASVSLVKLKAEALINGLFARTALTCTFLNERDALMEGEFLLRLPAGATVTGYALDVNGAMVDGVIVDKNKSRMAFESEKNRRIDPGLVEWVDGQVFRTRVYPINAFQTRTVRLEYVQPLAAHAGRLFYRLPFTGYPELAELEVKVVAQHLPASIELTRIPFAGLEPAKTPDGLTLATTMENVKPDGELVLGCRFPEGPLLDLARIDDETVAFTAAVPLPKGTPPKRTGPGNHMVLYWDASASMSDTGRQRAREFLTQFLSRYREVNQVDLVVFRNEQEKPVHFMRTANGFRDLLTAIENLAVDGGTNLFDLTAPAAGDFAMLVSDGRDVINGLGVPDFAMPVFAVQPETFGSDHLMRAMAKLSGGDYVDLSNTKTAAAVTQWGRAVAHLRQQGKLSNRVEALTESDAGNLADRVWVSGRLRGKAPLNLPLTVGYPNQAADAVFLHLDPSQARPDAMAAIWWAQSYVRDLSAQPYAHRNEIVALAKRFRLTTPFTSLIVLESLDQYVRHRIKPPESLPKMRAAYLEQLAESSGDFAETVAEYREETRLNFDDWVKKLTRIEDLPTDLAKLRGENAALWHEDLARIEPQPADDEVSESRTEVGDADVAPADGEPTRMEVAPAKPELEMVAAPEPYVAGSLFNLVNEPLAGMKITLKVHGVQDEEEIVKTVQSDGQGRFRIDELPSGTYSLTIEHKDFISYQSDPFTLMGRRGFAVHRRLVPDPNKPFKLAVGRPSPVVVNVVDPDGNPLPGIVVRIVEQAQAGTARTSTHASTNALGQAELKDLKSGAYVVSGLLSHHQVVSVETLPSSGDQTRLHVVMKAVEHHEFVVAAALSAAARNEGETLAVTAWSADIPYVAALDRSAPAARYQSYLKLRDKYAGMPAFYLDCARVFFKDGQISLGKRILTNLLEMGVEDAAMMRVTAFVFSEFGLLEEADNLYEKLVRLRPEWPQARRERALVLAARGRLADADGDAETAKAYFGLALALMGDAFWRPWGELPDEMALVYLEDGRYEGFDTLAATDYHGLRQEAQRRFGLAGRRLAYAPLEPFFKDDVQADLMVTLEWDDAEADMDLWVIEPSGEPCFWENDETDFGGILSADLTSGMGPEAYMIRKALPGEYQIVVHYYGSQRLDVNGPTTCVATIIYHFGRAEERREKITIRLDRDDQAEKIAVVRWGDPVR